MADDLIPLPQNFSQLARQIAMDILPLDDILELHRLTDQQWVSIQANPHFQATLTDMVTEWNSAANTKARVRIKAATGIEALLEPAIAACMDTTIPLNQRIEGMKFLAKLGELMDQPEFGGGAAADRVMINIYTGNPASSVVIDALPIRQDEVTDVEG
jgi:hypothetical protein